MPFDEPRITNRLKNNKTPLHSGALIVTINQQLETSN
jgi:hypothetical protein